MTVCSTIPRTRICFSACFLLVHFASTRPVSLLTTLKHFLPGTFRIAYGIIFQCKGPQICSRVKRFLSQTFWPLHRNHRQVSGQQITVVQGVYVVKFGLQRRVDFFLACPAGEDNTIPRLCFARDAPQTAEELSHFPRRENQTC